MIAALRTRPVLTLLMAALLVSILGLLAMGQARTAGPSVRAKGPEGWFAARRYLEARGAQVQLLDGLPRPEALRQAGEGALPALITAHPWSRLELGEGLDAYPHYMAAGGTLVLAYGNQPDALQEALLFEALGLETATAREESPWGPRAWRRWVDEEWRLEPPSGGEGAEPVIVHPPERIPVPPEDAEVLYRRQGTSTAVIWSAPRGQGRLLVLPAEALANGRLAKAGNADLLEDLRHQLGDRWAFDEYHHGLVPPGEARASVSSVALDLFGAHLALLYGLGLWALARRFGPPWRNPPVRTGSAGTFLRGLGRLHHKLGHHQQAARLLVERSRQLDARLPPPPEDLLAGAESSRSGLGAKGLVELAQRVARARARGSWERIGQTTQERG